MIPSFWRDGASLRIYAAHEAELAEFTSRHGLKRADSLGQIRHFRHETVDLEVYVNAQSGPSVTLMCGLSLANAHNHTRHILIGSSGHTELSLGTWYHPSALQLDVGGSPRTLYPSLMGCDSFASTEHLTRPAFSPGYPLSGGVDLESYYWFQAMSRQLNQESLGLLRFVSDTPEVSVEDEHNFSGMKEIAQQSWSEYQDGIFKWLSFHCSRSAELSNRNPKVSIPESFSQFRWSKTQELELMRLLERCEVLEIELESWIEKIGSQARSRKDLLKTLRTFVDGHEVHLHG